MFLLIKECLFPRFCVGCHRPGNYICYSCRLRLQPLYDEHRLEGIDGVISPYIYSSYVGSIIKMGKYGGHYAILEELCNDLPRHIDTKIKVLRSTLGGELVAVPVPLHARRQRERGFNQAEVIATCLSRAYGMPMVSGVLTRSKFCVAQALLPREHRLRNIQMHAGFTCKSHVSSLEKRAALLVDDVTTTGATLRAAAKALRDAGVQSVYAFVLACSKYTPQ